MTPIEFVVDENSNHLVLAFDKLPMALRTNLRVAITALTNELLEQVKAREPVRTGLMRSRTRAFVDERTDPGNEFIRGSVRILGTGRAQRTAAAFGALEYGAHRTFEVSSYRRRGFMVGSYQRTANIEERRFLRGPFEAMHERITATLNAAVQKTIAESDRA